MRHQVDRTDNERGRHESLRAARRHKHIRVRIIGVGDNVYTIFFKYEICEIDKNGVVVNSVSCVDSQIVSTSQIYLTSAGSQENTLQVAADGRR